MSTLYPDLTTNFPNAIDPNKTFSDVNSTNASYVTQYEQYIAAGNYSAAATLMTTYPALKNIIITAATIQLLYDQNIAEQRFFDSTIIDSIGQVVKYIGTWNSSTTYSLFNIVVYNAYCYMCVSSSTPSGTLPTDTTYWALMTIQGPAGTGLTPYTSWSNTTTYNSTAMVPYSNKLWMSLQDNNLNHQPDTSPTYWQYIAIVNQQVLTQSTQPTTQMSGDIWYEVLS